MCRCRQEHNATTQNTCLIEDITRSIYPTLYDSLEYEGKNCVDMTVNLGCIKEKESISMTMAGMYWDVTIEEADDTYVERPLDISVCII